MSRRTRRAGFTLVELVALSGAMALMGTQLLEAIIQSREAARRSQCKNNLRQIALSIHNYHDTFVKLPPGWIGVDSKANRANVFGLNGWGWGARMLPFLDQAPLYNKLNFSLGIADPDSDNAKIYGVNMKLMRCPSDSFTKNTLVLKDEKGEPVAEVGPSNYPGSFGTGDLSKCEKMKSGERCQSDGLFEHNGSLGFGDFKDGLSNTIGVGERQISEKSDTVTTWAGVFPKAKSPFARILASSDKELKTKEPNPSGYNSAHQGGVHFMICDGSVRFFKSDLDLKTFQALTTRAGGEELPQE